MPRYSTASASDEYDDTPRIGSSSSNRLNSTPRFQLPFNNNNNSNSLPASSDGGEVGVGGDDNDSEEEEEAWDEVDIPPQQEEQQTQSTTSQQRDGVEIEKGKGGGIEIVIRKAGEKDQTGGDSKNKK